MIAITRLGTAIATVLTGPGDTVIDTVAAVPSIVAVMVTTPGATEPTRPLLVTMPTAAFDVDQVIARPAMTVPDASRATAVACWEVLGTMVRLGTVIATVLTGTGETVIDTVAVLPSIVAVIITTPGATEPTTPLLLTMPTVGFDDDQMTARPTMTLPDASRATAVACCVVLGTMVRLGTVTTMVLTGTGETVIDTVVDFPSDVAMIIAEPAATPVTTPLAETDATLVAALDQVTVRPVSVAPCASLVVATSASVWPTITDPAPAFTSMVFTGAGATVMFTVAVRPPEAAVITKSPGTTPVTVPVDVTVAMFEALVVKVMAGAVAQLAYAAVACRVVEPPGKMMRTGADKSTFETVQIAGVAGVGVAGSELQALSTTANAMKSAETRCRAE